MAHALSEFASSGHESSSIRPLRSHSAVPAAVAAAPQPSDDSSDYLIVDGCSASDEEALGLPPSPPNPPLLPSRQASKAANSTAERNRERATHAYANVQSTVGRSLSLQHATAAAAAAADCVSKKKLELLKISLFRQIRIVEFRLHTKFSVNYNVITY